MGTPEERSAYLRRQVLVYDRLIRYLADTSQSRKAFAVAERFRGRSFLEVLGERGMRSGRGRFAA